MGKTPDVAIGNLGWSLDGPLDSPLSADMPWLRRVPDPPYPPGYPRVPPMDVPIPNHTELRNEPYWYMARELWVLSGSGYQAGQGGLSASIQMANAMEPVRRYRASERLYNERQPNGNPRRLVPGDDFAFSYAGPERGNPPASSAAPTRSRASAGSASPPTPAKTRPPSTSGRP